MFGANNLPLPLAYADSPSREHDHLHSGCHSPGVSTPVGLALLLPSPALRCLRTRTPTSMGTLEHGGCCCGHGRHSRRIGRATRTEATVPHRGRRHHVVRPPEPHHWRTRALRERADGRTGTGAPLLLGLSVGTHAEGCSSALPSLSPSLPPPSLRGDSSDAPHYISPSLAPSLLPFLPPSFPPSLPPSLPTSLPPYLPNYGPCSGL